MESRFTFTLNFAYSNFIIKNGAVYRLSELPLNLYPISKQAEELGLTIGGKLLCEISFPEIVKIENLDGFSYKFTVKEDENSWIHTKIYLQEQFKQVIEFTRSEGKEGWENYSAETRRLLQQHQDFLVQYQRSMQRYNESLRESQRLIKNYHNLLEQLRFMQEQKREQFIDFCQNFLLGFFTYLIVILLFL